MKQYIRMMLDPTLAATAGASAASQAAAALPNALFAHFQNVKNRKFAREQYKTQRQDALADWEMNNAYNSPRAQMQRFREAGLNPNLIYGQMSEASPVRSSNAPSAQGSAPEMRIDNPYMAAISAKKDMSQISILERIETQRMEDEHNKTLAEIIQIQSNTNKANLDAEGIKLDNTLKERLQDTHVLQGKATLNKTLADTTYTLDQNDRAAAKNAQDLAEGVERVLKSKAERGQIKITNDKLKEEIANLKKEGKIKDFDVELTEQNIRPGDPLWFRAMATLIQVILTKFGIGDYNNNPNQRPGESLEEYRKRKSVGKHK